MRVILNSDILFTNWPLSRGLSPPLQKLVIECVKVGALIVLPETTLLEVERQQARLIQTEILNVEKAYRTLRTLGIAFDEKNPAGLFEMPNLAKLFEASGAKVEIEEPSLDDYRDAHRRACLHLSPHPPEGESDEMRDLVIWAMALRLARKDKAILLSRDKVHSHDRGDEEATGAGLLRASDVDEALELLGVENPATRLVRLLLEPIWDDLRSEQLPLPEKFNLQNIEDAVFVRGDAGIDQAKFKFQTTTDDKRTLGAEVEINREREDLASLAFRKISVDGQPLAEVDVVINKTVTIPAADADEPLAELRDIIGGQ